MKEVLKELLRIFSLALPVELRRYCLVSSVQLCFLRIFPLHLTLCIIVPSFVAVQIDILRRKMILLLLKPFAKDKNKY